MDQTKDIEVGVLCDIAQSIPGCGSGDTVTIEIRRLADGYTWDFATLAFSSGANTGDMIFVSGGWWKQSFTPAAAGTYLVTITNATMDVPYYQTLIARIPSAPSPAVVEITTVTPANMVSTIDYVISQLLAGMVVKQYSIGGKTITREDIDKLQSLRQYYAGLAGARLNRTTYATFGSE